jgi:hypothetical protein
MRRTRHEMRGPRILYEEVADFGGGEVAHFGRLGVEYWRDGRRKLAAEKVTDFGRGAWMGLAFKPWDADGLRGRGWGGTKGWWGLNEDQ